MQRSEKKDELYQRFSKFEGQWHVAGEFYKESLKSLDEVSPKKRHMLYETPSFENSG